MVFKVTGRKSPVKHIDGVVLHFLDLLTVQKTLIILG